MNMKRVSTRKWLITGPLLSALALTIFAHDRPARAGGLGTLIKIGGVAAAISLFGKDMNNAINGLYQRNGVASRDATKVVAILSIGNGTHLGAAQVVGPKERIDEVQAVAQGEIQPGPLRLRALIPIASKNITKGEMKTVGGVGVSAIIDLKL